MRHGGFRPDATGAFLLGIRHGLYCIGCCWALMLLLFVGGVMNILWIAALAGLVLAEKLVPFAKLLSRIAGCAFVAAGVWLLI
jgi:predicted metal-binding membrane protein